MIVLTHKTRIKVDKKLKKANRLCGLGLFGIGVFGMLMANPEKVDAFAEKALKDADEIKQIEDFDERVKKEHEWLIFEGTPIVALIALPIASCLAILRSNSLHNQVFNTCKDELYDRPDIVRDALDYNFPDKV